MYSICFREHLKVGTGSANRSGTLQSNVQMMEAVVVISEVSERAIPSCYRACSSMTEVPFSLTEMYFCMKCLNLEEEKKKNLLNGGIILFLVVMAEPVLAYQK